MTTRLLGTATAELRGKPLHDTSSNRNLNCSRHRSTARDDASDKLNGMLTLCLGSGEMGVKRLEGDWVDMTDTFTDWLHSLPLAALPWLTG
jgi:hypothetical protein